MEITLRKSGEKKVYVQKTNIKEMQTRLLNKADVVATQIALQVVSNENSTRKIRKETYKPWFQVLYAVLFIIGFIMAYYNI